MASFVITGASRGIGFEFLRQLSSDPRNVVIGLVRDKLTTDTTVAQKLVGRQNIHILQADITDYNALKKSVEQTSKITGGSLDYIIANAGLVSSWSAYDPLSVLGNRPKELEDDLLDSFKVNVIGNIHLFNLFMPLVLKGKAKKVVAISSGMADVEFISKFDIEPAAPYSISKAGTNVVVAKFSAEYRKEGVLFLSISPGVVDTGGYEKATEEQKKNAAAMMAKFASYAPHFTGPITPEASVKHMLSVINEASIEAGDGGSFISHYGNKQWL